MLTSRPRRSDNRRSCRKRRRLECRWRSGRCTETRQSCSLKIYQNLLDRRDVIRCIKKLTRTSVCDVESNALDDDKIGREAWVIQEEEPCARGDVTSVVGGDREWVG